MTFLIAEPHPLVSRPKAPAAQLFPWPLAIALLAQCMHARARRDRLGGVGPVEVPC